MENAKYAFVTYNQIGRRKTIPDGWNESNGFRAFVLQNTKGEVKSGSPIGIDNRIEQITSFWSELEKVLPELDHIVIYLGTNGSQKAIELAAQHIPAEKITFVTCDCGLPIKALLITATGLSRAGRVDCECGGFDTMEMLYKHFMVTGRLLGQPVAV